MKGSLNTQLTHFQAVEWDRVLPNKLVVGGGVVVFNDEADQSKLRHVHVELEVFIPRWVKALKQKGGWGRMASVTLISQMFFSTIFCCFILNGDKTLSLEK